MREELGLYPFQLEAAEWLSKKRFALLAYEMGLGKTIIAIHAAVQACRQQEGFAEWLILCPPVAITNWVREIKRYTETFGQQFTGFRVVPYSLAHRVTLTHQYQVCILDESHYLKSTDARRTKAVLGKEGLIRRCDRVWALSGTPAPNNASELWPLLYTFGATKLSFDEFTEKFCEQRTFKIGGVVRKRVIAGTKTSSIPELKALLAPVMLRKRKEEVIDLPPITFEHITVIPGEVDYEISVPFVKYVFPKDTREELFAKLEKEAALLKTVMEGVSARNDQIKALDGIADSIATLRMFTGCQKIDPVYELVKWELETNAYDKIVIFALHRDVIWGLREKLKDFGAVTVYGGTPPDQRQRNIDRFQTNPKCRVFIGNIHAAGTAITLTAAHQMLFVELDYTPGANAQAAFRCHRIGQKNKVTVRIVSLENSVDEKVNELLKRKTNELAMIFDDKAIPQNDPRRQFKKIKEEEVLKNELDTLLS